MGDELAKKSFSVSDGGPTRFGAEEGGMEGAGGGGCENGLESLPHPLSGT